MRILRSQELSAHTSALTAVTLSLTPFCAAENSVLEHSSEYSEKPYTPHKLVVTVDVEQVFESLIGTREDQELAQVRLIDWKIDFEQAASLCFPKASLRCGWSGSGRGGRNRRFSSGGCRGSPTASVKIFWVSVCSEITRRRPGGSGAPARPPHRIVGIPELRNKSITSSWNRANEDGLARIVPEGAAQGPDILSQGRRRTSLPHGAYELVFVDEVAVSNEHQ
jgi:hypothetical protein